MTDPRRPACASQDWMLEQQVRAELEAETWRRLRELAEIREVPPDMVFSAAPHAEPDYHTTGSIMLKALVRFMIAASGAYVGWIAAVDSRLSDFETLLSVCGAFIVTLSVTLFGPARHFVHLLAETVRWLLYVSAAVGLLWLLLQGQA